MKETEFTNGPINPDALPRYEEVAIHPIAPSYWYVIVINIAIVTLIIGGAGSFVLFSAGSALLVAGVLGAWLLFMLAQLLVRRTAFRKRGYALRERDVIYRRGLLATVTTIVPFNRIQHVSINEGVLSRRFGLAQLQLFTAGGSSANMVISGLPKAEAERIKTFIMGNIHPMEKVVSDVQRESEND